MIGSVLSTPKLICLPFGLVSFYFRFGSDAQPLFTGAPVCVTLFRSVNLLIFGEFRSDSSLAPRVVRRFVGAFVTISSVEYLIVTS